MQVVVVLAAWTEVGVLLKFILGKFRIWRVQSITLSSCWKFVKNTQCLLCKPHKNHLKPVAADNSVLVCLACKAAEYQYSGGYDIIIRRPVECKFGYPASRKGKFTGWLRLEGTSGGPLVQPLCSGMAT